MEVGCANFLCDNGMCDDVGGCTGTTGCYDFVGTNPTFEYLFIFDEGVDEFVEVGEVDGGLFVGSGSAWMKGPLIRGCVIEEETLFGFSHELGKEQRHFRVVVGPRQVWEWPIVGGR